MKLLNSELSKKTDQITIEKYIPGILLMERAAANIYYKTIENYGKINGKKIGIFCGGGNNGGDGFAAARYFAKESNVKLFFLEDRDKLPQDAATNHDICRNMEICFLDRYEGDFDIIIDAILGIGLNKKLDGEYLKAVEFINNSTAFVVSVDIPTGVSSDTGEIFNYAVQADITVTFHSAKIGHILYPGKSMCGILEVTDIGIPVEAEQYSRYEALIYDSVFVNKREKRIHKGDAGKILIIGGSRGMTGAPYMASEGALRSGAGLVTVAIPESLNMIMEIKTTEAMTLPLPETEHGNISISAFEKISDFILKNKIDVVVIGVGIGREEETLELVRKIIKEIECVMVIDADGLYAIKDEPEIIDDKKIIITPHEGEFTRIRKGEKISNRLYDAETFAKQHNIALVLKGADTIVTNGSKSGINTTGNPGMATGGSGDVLAGVIAAFAAQNYTLYDAAKTAVFLHGLAGDIAAEESCEEGILPRDITAKLGEAIRCVKER